MKLFNKKYFFIILFFISLFFLFNIKEEAMAAGEVPVYRAYDKRTGEHLYTTSRDEYINLHLSGWNMEGEAWEGEAFSTLPVYRFRNPSNQDHHFTFDQSEASFLINEGWILEGVSFYSAAANTGVPVYRLYNRNTTLSGAHHYTASEAERDFLTEKGWEYEGISFYVKPHQGPKSVFIRYDDEFDLSEISSGIVESINDIKITSNVVRAGALTEETDKSCILPLSENKVYAAGVGVSDIKLSTGEVIEVNVLSAPLTIMFLAGQSNMEGITMNNIQSPMDSVVLKKGESYATFYEGINKNEDFFSHIFGYNDWAGNPDSYVPGSLSRDNEAAIDGSFLGSRLNDTSLLDAFTESHEGKSGLDSGLTYEYNRLTNDKVWVINGALGATSVKDWVDKEMSYNIFLDALKVYNAEVSSGHFTASKKYMLYMQGEADQGMTVTQYKTNLMTVYYRYKAALKFEKFGIIPVRAGDNFETDGSWMSDIRMTVPRTAQYQLIVEYPDIILASNVHELWVTDEKVRNYFYSAYPEGVFTYPLRPGVSNVLPTTVNEIHADIHFSQKGHNENGITAARGLLGQ